MQTNSISIELDAEIAAQVRKAVESGEYGSSSEVIEDALREWALLRDRSIGDIGALRKAWDEVKDDDSPGQPAMEVLDRLERKYRALAESQSPPGRCKSMQSV